MNAQDALRSKVCECENCLRFPERFTITTLWDLRVALGWDGSGEPPIVAIMGDGQLKRLEQAYEAPFWSHLYRLVDPEAEQDAR